MLAPTNKYNFLFGYTDKFFGAICSPLQTLIDENNYSEKTVFRIFRFNVYDKTDEMLF